MRTASVRLPIVVILMIFTTMVSIYMSVNILHQNNLIQDENSHFLVEPVEPAEADDPGDADRPREADGPKEVDGLKVPFARIVDQQDRKVFIFKYPSSNNDSEQKPQGGKDIVSNKNVRRKKVDDVEMMEKEKERISTNKQLLLLHETLYRAWRVARGAKASVEIRKAIELTEQLLSSPPKVMPVQKALYKSTYVCPENYKGSTYDYPFFNKGFDVIKCPIKKNINDYLTILLDFANTDAKNVAAVLNGINEKYPKLSVYAAWKKDISDIKKKYSRIEFFEHNKDISIGSTWNSLIRKVTTEFALIGRDIHLFDAFDARLERLVRVLDEVGVNVTAGARRALVDGLWHNGCYQSAVKNYTLSYTEGYDSSVIECLYCDYASGPFVARTSFIKSIKFADDLIDDMLYRDFFLRLQSQHYSTLVCPDAMFYTAPLSHTLSEQRESWIPLISRHDIGKVRLSNGISFLYTCEESNTVCRMRRGVGLPPCCLKHLAYAVNFFMKTCEDANIICELQEGTMLGAVKLNKILPWERDADLTFLTSNFSALASKVNLFRQAGMSASFNQDALWCCVDGIQAGGTGMVYFKEWHLEIYGQHIMDSETLRKRGLTPTRLNFDGQVINVPRNPGLFARNRYGHQIYGHSQHWMSIGGSSGWIDYKPSVFSKCDDATSGCLDQFFADGNIQFQEVIP